MTKIGFGITITIGIVRDVDVMTGTKQRTDAGMPLYCVRWPFLPCFLMALVLLHCEGKIGKHLECWCTHHLTLGKENDTPLR